MTLYEAAELLEYLAYNPSSEELTCAKYKIKIGKPKKFSIPDEKEFIGNLSEAAAIMDVSEKPPEDFVQNINWAKEMMAKMGKKEVN